MSRKNNKSRAKKPPKNNQGSKELRSNYDSTSDNDLVGNDSNGVANVVKSEEMDGEKSEITIGNEKGNASKELELGTSNDDDSTKDSRSNVESLGTDETDMKLIREPNLESIKDDKELSPPVARIPKNMENEEIELENIKNNEDDTSSLKSTEAVLEADDDELNNLSNSSRQELSEQQLNPDLSKFMTACQQGELSVVENLISSGIVKANDVFSDGITGLHWASINNRLSIVKYLIQNKYSKADPNNLGGELKASPLHWACRNGLVYIVDYLMTNANADPTLKDSQSYNALHLAVHSSNITLVIYILLTCCDNNSVKKIYVDEPDCFNRTSLHWAAYQGDILTINALLKFGADVSKVDNTLFVPIHWAFMKGYKAVLTRLVEAGSDIQAKNDQGKNTFDIAKDMNCYDTWLKVLKECGRDPKNNWNTKSNLIDPKLGKIITFLTPYVILPIVFHICSFSNGFAIPKLFISLIIFIGSTFLVNKIIVPTYLIDDKALTKSPFLAGIFSGTAFWAMLIWIYNILPNLIWRRFISNILLGGLIGLFVWSFFKSMFINPGFVPTPSDNKTILNQVRDLIKIGKFDTDNFCVNTYVRKPLRSRYSRINKRLIARFDHYCPWVCNEIGVRNHKLFMIFVYSLNLAILLFIYLSIKFFDKLEDGYDSDDESVNCAVLSNELCYGYRNNYFHFNLLFWCLLQYIWIAFLCVVQTFQIFKGVTTWEFSLLSNKLHYHANNHSSLPSDFNGDNPINDPLNLINAPKRNSELNTCLSLLGLDQFVLTVKLSLASLFKKTSSASDLNTYESLSDFDIPSNYGLKQNWLDFWYLGEIKLRNLFYLPIEGENNLNGKVVDYYKLYEYPGKVPTNELV